MQRKPRGLTYDDWEIWTPAPMTGSASPLGPVAKGRKPRPLGLLASARRKPAKKERR